MDPQRCLGGEEKQLRVFFFHVAGRHTRLTARRRHARFGIAAERACLRRAVKRLIHEVILPRPLSLGIRAAREICRTPRDQRNKKGSS